MTHEQDLTRRFGKLDAAISRDAERRRKIRLTYWILLLITAGVAALVILVARSEPEAVAKAMTNDPEAIKTIAGSDEMVSAVDHAVATGTEKLTEGVLASEALAGRIQASARQAAEDYPQQPAFRKMVQEAADGALDYLGRDIRENRDAMRKLSTWQGGADEKLRTVAHEQSALAGRIEISEKAGKQQGEQIATLLADLKELRARVEKLPPESAEPRSTHSYLLKENSQTELHDLGLLVTLGHSSKDRLEKVVFSDTRGPFGDGKIAAASFGEPVYFTDRNGCEYEATFTYSQARFIAKDYVGLELSRTPDPCKVDQERSER